MIRKPIVLILLGLVLTVSVSSVGVAGPAPPYPRRHRQSKRRDPATRIASAAMPTRTSRKRREASRFRSLQTRPFSMRPSTGNYSVRPATPASPRFPTPRSSPPSSARGATPKRRASSPRVSTVHRGSTARAVTGPTRLRLPKSWGRPHVKPAMNKPSSSIWEVSTAAPSPTVSRRQPCASTATARLIGCGRRRTRILPPTGTAWRRPAVAAMPTALWSSVGRFQSPKHINSIKRACTAGR